MIKRFSFILFAVLLSCKCVDSKSQDTNNYSDTLIQVGSITVSKPFFNRDVRNFISSTSPHKVDSSELRKWYNNYLDNLLLTNSAKDNGFLIRSDVEEAAVGFENYVLIQKGSSFYAANINSKITISPSEVEDAYNKMSSVAGFSLIRFSNNETYLNALKGQKPYDAIFREYKNANNDSIKYIHGEVVWPSLEFWYLQYQIKSLKAGEISGPVYARCDEFSNAIYLVRVDSIWQNVRNSFTSEKQRLEIILNKIKEDSLYDRYEKTILQKANIQLNKNNLSDSLVKCFIKYSNNPKDPHLKSYLKVELMKYSLNGSQIIVTVNDFLKYYSNLPIRLNFRTRSEINNFLYYFVLSSYMVIDASVANFDKESRYLALKIDLRNKFALQKFEEELYDKVSVTEMECKAFYHNQLLNHNEWNSVKSYEKSKEQIYSHLKDQKYIAVKDSLLKQSRTKYPFHRVPSFMQVKNLIQ